MNTEHAEHTQEIAVQSPEGAWIIEVTSPETTTSARLPPGGKLVLGTSASGVQVEDRSVSHRHVELNWTEQGVHVRDLDSRNGTYLAAARIREARLVATGSHFQIGRSLVVLRAETAEEARVPANDLPGLVGSSLVMRRLAEEIRRVARLRAPVLVLGESGTGKDVVASALHSLSGRRGQLVPLNVGALSEGLADAELFGHTKGAFTGAVAERAGAFELADGGSLFLDEIADLSPALQVKLLRVVEDGRVRALGSGVYREVSTRVISATWADLSERAEQGRFREDLLHRISTLVLRLPPLRARRSDIAALSVALLRRFEPELGPLTLSSLALSVLTQHEWPGNVRELAAVLYRAALTARGGVVQGSDVQLASTVKQQRAKTVATPDEALKALEEHRGNVSAAARALRVPRSTFRAWVERAG